MANSTTQPAKSTPAESASTAPEFVKGLGLTSSTMLVMGSMIGSGIFIVSADIARQTNSPGLLILAWVITGIMTLIGALSYGELAAMMPRAGGQYVYIREGLGPLLGFLYGWTLFLVIWSGVIAAVAVAFGRFLGVFFPSISSDIWIWHIGHVPRWAIGPIELGNMDVGINTQNLVGILMVILLTAVNVLGVRTGAWVQNIFTFAKTAALLGLIILGIFFGHNHTAIAANFTHFWRNASLGAQHQISGTTIMVSTITILAIAQVGSLFSADAWGIITFTAGEVKNPRRNVPLSLVLGVGAVILLYIAANFSYLMVLPMDGSPSGATALARGIKYASGPDRVGTAVLEQMFGPMGALLMAIAILVSTFGCNNGLILGGARVYYAMARDGLFFKSAGRLHEKYRTPIMALVAQAVIVCLLCLSGTYGQLLDYTIFAELLFYIFTIAALFVLRYRQPDAERPYRAFGYPVLPGLYILMALFIDVVLLRYKPQYTWPGLIIVLLGVPVYLFWSRKTAPRG